MAESEQMSKEFTALGRNDTVSYDGQVFMSCAGSLLGWKLSHQDDNHDAGHMLWYDRS